MRNRSVFWSERISKWFIVVIVSSQRKLQAKNIQECLHMCCLSKGCDLAMLKDRTCYNVKCYNATTCETVPSDDEDISMQIVRVSSKGTGNDMKKANVSDPEAFDPDAKCPHNEVLYHVKLKAGLQAGKFTDIGKVKSIMTCVRYCCESRVECDLAFMLKDRCYLVKCYSEDRCTTVPAGAKDYAFHQKMAFVAPWLFEKNKKMVSVPSARYPDHLNCVQSKLYSRATLFGGPKAGHFKDMGPIGKTHICTRMCCEDPKCDLAYMFGKNCFLVTCYSEKGCRVIDDGEVRNATKAHGVKNHERTVQFIIRRRFNVALREDGKPVRLVKPGDNICHADGKIHHQTVLKAGMLSGKLTPHKDVKTMKSCIHKCCHDNNCHVAYMMSNLCYSVMCTNEDYCTPKDAPSEMHHAKPMLAFVKRGHLSFAPKSTPAPQPVQANAATITTQYGPQQGLGLLPQAAPAATAQFSTAGTTQSVVEVASEVPDETAAALASQPVAAQQPEVSQQAVTGEQDGSIVTGEKEVTDLVQEDQQQLLTQQPEQQDRVETVAGS